MPAANSIINYFYTYKKLKTLDKDYYSDFLKSYEELKTGIAEIEPKSGKYRLGLLMQYLNRCH